MSTLLQHIRRLKQGPAATSGDPDLLRRFLQEADEAAFEAIVRRHGGMVFDVCRSILGDPAAAEDAFQAVFLVLAQHAAKIKTAPSLASWLHGVAYRTATKAQANILRRRRHELQAAVETPLQNEDLTWRDTRRVIHEELATLAEKHRAPLVLCYLQGMTQDEAAAALGLPKGTLKGRLEKARARLRGRLLRRGLGPAAALFAAALPEAGAAPLPGAALSAAVSNAAAVIRNAPLAISPNVSTLVAQVAPSLASPLPQRLLALVLLLLISAGGVWSFTTSASPAQNADKDTPKLADAPKPQALSPETAAAWKRSGAELYWLYPFDMGNQFAVGFYDGGTPGSDAVAGLRYPLKREFETGAFRALPRPATSFGLDVAGTKIKDESLAEIAELEHLRLLGLNFCNELSPDGMKHVARLPRLETLHLSHTKITDAGLAHLRERHTLRWLNLNCTRVTDAGVRHLAGMPHLDSLFLDHNPVGTDSLRIIGQLKKMRLLSLEVTDVSDDGLKHLAGLKDLETLRLGWTKVTDRGLRELKVLKRLQTLGLRFNKITGVGLVDLAGLPELRKLDLGWCQLTQQGMAGLGELKSVRELCLTECGMTDASLLHVAKLTGLHVLDLYGGAITDAGLASLGTLTQLKELRLRCPNVTEAGVNGLRLALPTASIHNEVPRGPR